MNYQELGAIINRLPKSDKQVLLPLRITNVDDKNATVSFTAINQDSINLQYRLNGQSTYQNWDYSAVELQPGDYVEFIGINDVAFAVSTEIFSKFNISNGNVELSGNIQSLIVGENLNPDPVDLVNPAQFGGLFLGNETIINAHKLMLPARSLTYGCYAGMFSGCISLTTAPELPATTLAESCYFSMFSGCHSLTTPPELSATTLAESCYQYMFDDCDSLETPPELPATTLAGLCYKYMFNACYSLKTAPELPATTLAESCYYGMFNMCYSLETPPELPATNLAEECYKQMFSDCDSLTTAPELPATTLAGSCYYGMFNNCKKLKSIKVSFVEWSSGYYTLAWMSGVVGQGTFTCPSSLPDQRGEDYIPEGWNVVYE